MTHGFDLNSPLVCEGIVGDGCGGGRLFVVEDTTLKAYDPLTKEFTILLDGLKEVISISKDGCIISIESDKTNIEFDLSTFKE